MLLNFSSIRAMALCDFFQTFGVASKRLSSIEET
jgi:hypothetical protein